MKPPIDEQFAKPACQSEPLAPISVRRSGRGPWIQLFSPRGFEWNLYELPIPGLPTELDGLRVIQLTDIHLNPRWFRAFDELLSRIKANTPDLILISGDLIDHRFDHRPSLASLKRFLDALTARLGVYTIIGNHDGDLLAPHIARSGIHFINGRSARLSDGQNTIELLGVPGVHHDDIADGFLRQIPPRGQQTLRIVLSHYPDSLADLADLQPDIILSGHTHGGQICLPGGWPPFTHDTLPRKFAKGVHRIQNTWLIVGRGFGFATYPIRMFCPGEVVELVLRKA